MSDYAFELLVNDYDFVCELLCDMVDDKDVTPEEIKALQTRRNSLQETIMKLNGITYNDLRK